MESYESIALKLAEDDYAWSQNMILDKGFYHHEIFDKLVPDNMHQTVCLCYLWFPI